MSRIKYGKIFTVDTESNKDGSLYLVSLFDTEEHTYKLFYSIIEFQDYLNTIPENVLMYVHNFGDWDSYFLLTPDNVEHEHKVIAANKKIFKYTTKEKVKTSKIVNNRVRTKTHNVYRTYEDTLPKTMISLENFAKTIGEPYVDLPDYDLYREPGNPEQWPDRQLIEDYARKDVYILYKLINAYREVFGEVFDKTVTAGSLVWREVVNHEVPDDKKRWARQNFRKIFVELTVEQDREIRLGYMGGITTPFYSAGIELTKPVLKKLYPWIKDPIIRADDISSAYAWAQVRELPVGNARVLNKEQSEAILMDENSTTFVRIQFSYSASDFPVIPKMNMGVHKKLDLSSGVIVENTQAKYMDTMLNGNHGVAVVSSIDLRFALNFDVYKNLKYKLIPFDSGNYGYSFRLGKYDKVVDITNKYYELKNTATDRALRQAYKSPLVNIYGKTGERVRTTKKELDVLTREIDETELENPLIAPYSNVGVASTITSYVHHKLYERGREVGFINMLYCDTDSMFYVSENDDIEIIEEELGTWNNEINGVDRALFICPKKYILEDASGKRIKSASAGISKRDESFNISNWMNGKRVYYKMERVQTVLGIMLEQKEVDVKASHFKFYDPRNFK